MQTFGKTVIPRIFGLQTIIKECSSNNNNNNSTNNDNDYNVINNDNTGE